MNPLLNYGGQVTIISGLLYSYYHFVLRNKKFHRYNRFYLLGAAGLSLLLPLFNIPVYFSEAETGSSFVYNTLTVLSGTGNEESVTVYAGIPEKESWFTLTHILRLVYISTAGLVLLRMIFSLLKIHRIIRRHAVEKIENIRFLNTEEPGTPFSFFRWLFWNRKIELNSEKGEQIFRHELFHIEQKHSLDLLFLELLTVAGWFNPFFHLMKRETRAIHEFLADQFAVTENNRWDYAELLLMQVLNTHQRLVHPFFQNQIKRRIAMITSPQKTSHQYLRKLMVLPVTALAVILFAFSYKNNKPVSKVPTGEKLTVIIDVGHGGEDPGVTGGDGEKEKNLVLSIAQKIKSLNQNGTYKIILTRERDFLPALKSRVDAGMGQTPALFLSLHINNSPDREKTGIEVYIPKKENKYFSESKALGAILIGKLAENFETTRNISQQKQTIWVLENSNCPSALVEIGYMSNAKDLAYISNPDNQVIIAQKILDAIDGFTLLGQVKKVTSSPSIPEDTAITPARHTAVFGNMVIISDSIIFRSAPPQDPKNNMQESITIMNGKRIFKMEYEGKAILCDSIEIYGKDDNKAIALYGSQARSGVKVIYNGKITDMEIKEADKPGADRVFEKVEIEAAFPGGMDAWRKYLERNLDAEVPVNQKAPAGIYTVIIQFIVNLDGSISDTRALTHHGYGMEAEAIRVIEKGPKWLPAIQNGRQVVAYRKQPITFVVDKGPKINGKVAAGEGKELKEVVVVGYSANTDPAFPGGDSAWKKYLAVNANSLVPVNNGAPDGQYKTRIKFIVHPDGHISDITSLTHFGYGMEDEAIRLIKSGPRWIPATREGTKVSSYKEQTITFELTGEPDRPNYPPVIQDKQPSPTLTVQELKNIDIYRLLQLPKGTEIISYVFLIDGDREVIEIPNTGNQINQKTRDLLNNATAGKLITVDMIRIREWDQLKKEYYTKKVPSRVWYVKD